MEPKRYTPPQVLELLLQAGKRRTLLPLPQLLLLGLLAGGFIAFGAAASSVAAHGIADVGLSRLAAAVVFPIGLMMIVLVGGELFTGDCLMVAGIWDGRYKTGAMLRTLAPVWLANAAGSIVIAALVSYSGIFDYSDGALGAYLIKTAVSKCSMPLPRAFCSGILCNVLVCAAVFLSNAATDVTGKLLGVFFPIMAFVVAGWEHCVANMFYIPAGIFAAGNEAYAAQAASLYGIDASSLSWLGFLHNLLPVTLGNMTGAMLFLALPLYLVYRKQLQTS